MLFELTNILAIYQKIVNNQLEYYFNIFVITYLDNIPIYYQTQEKYMKYVNRILKCLY